MKVIHFIRKEAQLKASFINNQIHYYNEYKPVVIFRQNERKWADKDGFKSNNDSGISIYNLGLTENLYEFFLFRLFKCLSKRQVNELLTIINEQKPDVFHFHYGTDAGIYLKALSKIDIPKFVSFYGYDCFSFPKKYFGLGKSYLKKRVFKYCTKIFAMSPEMESDISNIGCPPSKILVHYHGVPNNLKVVNRQYSSKIKYKLLILSYLDPVKGHLFILEAINMMLKRGLENFELDIVGDGFYYNVIKAKIKDLGLESNVFLSGEVQYLSSEYIAKFVDADIFLHPSVKTKNDKEGIPGALVEAMIAGLPVIATYHGGIPYIINHEQTGMLVEEWNVRDLSMTIERLINDSELRQHIGLSARQFAIENLDINIKMVEREKLYNINKE